MVLLLSGSVCQEASGVRALGGLWGWTCAAACSPGVFLTVALMLAWMCFNSAHYLFNPAMWSQISAPKMLFIATCTSLAPLLFAIATVPYAWSFLQDRESGFENPGGGTGGLLGLWLCQGPVCGPCRPSWRRR